MGETAGELRQRIESQRSTLGGDLDALGDRLSPKRMAERRKAAVQSRFQGVKESVMGSAAGAKDSMRGTVQDAPDMAREQVQGAPLAAGLLAFAAGLVVSALFPQTESEQRLTNRMQPRMEQVASEVGQAAQESAQNLKPVAQDAAQSVKEQAQESAHSVKDDAARARDNVMEQTRTNS